MRSGYYCVNNCFLSGARLLDSDPNLAIDYLSSVSIYTQLAHIWDEALNPLPNVKEGPPPRLRTCETERESLASPEN